MTALSSWNGGVILISHDERFITKVANEVGYRLLYRFMNYANDSVSFGCARTVRCRSSRAMYKHTRWVVIMFPAQ